MTRLPDNIQRILAAVDDSDSERLLHQADLIAGEFQQGHQRTSRIAAVIPSDAGTNEPWVAAFNTLREQMTQMRVQVQALSVSNQRRPRSRPRQRYELPPPFAVPRPAAERRPLLLPCDVRRSREGLSFPMHVEFGKRDQPSVDAANDDGLGTRRIFVRDRKARILFLVDTGADTCVYPRSRIREQVNKTDYELFAANGTRIAIYGTIMMSLDLSLRRPFEWRFVIADVQTPIIGVDFLSHYGLLVDPRNRRLLDTTTQLASKGYPASTKEMSIKTVYGETVYHRLLAEFPDLTRPPAFGREKIRHAVVHHIETTPAPPAPASLAASHQIDSSKSRQSSQP